MTPGRLPSISASAVSISASASSTAFGTLQIERDGSLAPPQRTFSERAVGVAERRLVRADDCDNLRAEVGEHAAGERPRADALELDDLKSGKRTHHATLPGATPILRLD